MAMAVHINDANAHILENYAKLRNVSIEECVNDLIARLQREEQNDYLAMLKQSNDDLLHGRTVTKTFTESCNGLIQAHQKSCYLRELLG